MNVRVSERDARERADVSDPLVRQEIWRTLGVLRQSGQSALVVDRDLAALSGLADRFAVMEKGRIVFSGTGAQLQSERGSIERYIHV